MKLRMIRKMMRTCSMRKFRVTSGDRTIGLDRVTAIVPTVEVETMGSRIGKATDPLLKTTMEDSNLTIRVSLISDIALKAEVNLAGRHPMQSVTLTKQLTASSPILRRLNHL